MFDHARTEIVLFAVVEPLHSRTLLAASVDLTNRGTLRIIADGTADAIVLSAFDAAVQVSVNGDPTSFDAAEVRRLFVSSAGGDDTIDLRASRWPATIAGGAGNDTIIGSRRDDAIDAGDGDDDVDGYSGSDTITLGLGIDVVTYERRAAAFSFLVFPEVDDSEDFRGLVARHGDDEVDGVVDEPEFVGGTPFDDAFTLGTAQSTLCRVLGRGGDDRFDSGSSGSAAFYGEAGDDTLVHVEGANVDFFGGRGNDTVAVEGASSPGFFEGFDGGPGIDTIRAGGWTRRVIDLNDATIFRNIENAVVRSGALNPQTAIGTDGPNDLRGSPFPGEFPGAAATLIGGGGNDTLDAGLANASLNGGDGDDLLIGNDGDDTLRGGSGDDTLTGGGGRDRLFGDGGDDLLLGRGGSKDRLDGGSGVDTATADTLGSVIDLLIDAEAVS